MPAIRKAFGRVLKTKTKDLGHGVVEVVVATNSKDRHGEILDIKGLNTKNYSGVVLLNHDYSSLPIGKSLGVRKKSEGGKDYLVSKTQFAVDEYPVASTTYRLVAGGYMPDVSIGFIPEQWDESTGTWTKSSMIEYSHVVIGANSDAKVVGKALKDIGIDKDEFEQQIRDHMLKIKELEDTLEEADKEFGSTDLNDFDIEQKAFEVQTLIFPKEKWDSVAAVKKWATDHDFRADKVDETDASWRLRQKDPGQFDSLRTICINPSKDTPMDECKVKAVGGNVKASIDSNDKTVQNVRKYLELALSALSDTGEALDELPQDTEADKETKTVKQRILLIRARKSINSLDRIAELAIGEINKSLN